jgi:hypothetical protein
MQGGLRLQTQALRLTNYVAAEEATMEKKPQTSPSDHVVIVRGADDQLAALERLWAQGEQIDPGADEAAWQTLRWALDESRREVGARPLFAATTLSRGGSPGEPHRPVALTTGLRCARSGRLQSNPRVSTFHRHGVKGTQQVQHGEDGLARICAHPPRTVVLPIVVRDVRGQPRG